MKSKNNKNKKTSKSYKKRLNQDKKLDLNLDAIEQMKEILKTPSDQSETLISYILESYDLESIELLSKHIDLKNFVSEEYIFKLCINLVKSDDNIDIFKAISNLGFSNFESYVDEWGYNLLHIASLYGSSQTVEYLVDDLGYKTNAPDGNGQNALHFAAFAAIDYSTIKVLIERSSKGDLQLEDDRGKNFVDCFPLEKCNFILAKFRKDKSISSKIGNDLISQLRYKIIDSNDDTPTLEERLSILEEVKPLEYHLMFNSYLKAALSETDRDRDANLKNAIGHAELHIKSLQTKLFSKDPSDKDNAKIQVEGCLNVLKYIYQTYKQIDLKFQGSSISDYITVTAKLWGLDHQLLSFYNIMSNIYLHDVDYTKASEYSKLAYELLLKQGEDYIPEQDRTSILFNRAKSISYSSPCKSLKLFDEVEKLSPGDWDVRIEKYKIFFGMGDIGNALKEAEKMPPKIADLYKMSAYINTSKGVFLLKLNEYNFDQYEGVEFKNSDHAATYLDICIFKYRYENRTDELIKILRSYLEQSLDYKGIETIDVILKFITVYEINSMWEEGSDFLQEMHKDFPSVFARANFPVLDYYQYILYEKSKQYELSKLCLQKLKASSQILADKAQESLFIASMQDQEYERALFYISLINDQNLAKKYKFLIQKLQKEESKKSQSLKIEEDGELLKSSLSGKQKDQSEESSSEEEDRNFVDLELIDICDIDSEEQFEKLLPNLTPKMIHEYFQYRKQKLSKDIEKLKNSSNASDVTSWSIDGKLYMHDGSSEDIIPMQGKDDFYLTISQDVWSKIDNSLYSKCINTLSKGLAASRKGSDGVIYAANQPVKLKFGQDIELYTKQVYVNSEGKYLIKFDLVGNHSTISNLSKKFKLKINKVESYVSDDSAWGECTGDIDSNLLVDQPTIEDLSILGDSNDIHD